MSKHQQIDSLVRFQNSQHDIVTGTLIQITRRSIVMEVYNPYSIVQLSEVLEDLFIRREERVVYHGRAVVNTLVNTGLYLVVSATLVDPWQDLSGLEHNTKGINTEAFRFLEDWENSNQLNNEFQLVIASIRSLLLELNRWLKQVDLFSEGDGITHFPDQTNTLFENLHHPIIPKLRSLFSEFEKQAARIPSQKVTNHKNYAQRDLHPLLMRSPFLWRTYNKPLGYAGDYEMVNMMLRNPYEGPTSYAKLINYLLVKSGPSLGHQNRINILEEKIQKKAHEKNASSFHILNIGCGPAIEIQQLIRHASCPLTILFTLVDFNKETLDYTRQEIEQLSNQHSHQFTFNYIHKSVHGLLKEAGQNNRTDMNYDMVYCAGLFDYLSDRVCSRLIRLFYQQVKKGGLILLTNVHKNNPSLYAMEYLMEWHLIYRDEESFLKLSPQPCEKTIYIDDSGTNLFMELIKE